MKMLYIISFDTAADGHAAGVRKKVFAMIKSFEKNGIDVQLYNRYVLKNRNILDKIICRLPFTAVHNCNYAYSHDIDGYDVYYLRFRCADYPTTRFLKKIRDNNKYAKIIIEFPNIDYMSSCKKRIRNIPVFLKNFFFTRRIHKIADRAVIMGKEDIYLSMPAIKIMNGIDLSDVKAKEPLRVKECINIGFVGLMQPCHGLDILIESLYIYIHKQNHENIHLHIVGTNPIFPSLKALADKYELNDYVTFYGILIGDELDRVLNQFDVGVSEIAPFRRDYELSSTLKSREYLARGIPVVSVSTIDVFYYYPCPFFKKLVLKNGIIEIEDICAFYHRLHSAYDEESIIRQIRAYAEAHISMDKTIEPIISYLSESQGENTENR